MGWRIALRLRHPTLGRGALDAATGLAARHGWEIGEPRRTPAGRPLEGWRDETYATYPLAEGDGQDLAAGIALALAQLEPRAAALDALGPDLARELFIGWFLSEGLGGDELPATLLGRLAALRLALGFDLYGA